MSRATLKEQSQFYDARWDGFEYANRFRLRRTIFILEGLAYTRLLEPRILDLGSGAGWLSAVLGTFGPTHGVELSPTAVSTATRRYPGIRFECADILNWQYRQEAYDLVVSHEVIEHVIEQEEYLRVARNALRPGGYLILTTPNADVFNSMPVEQQAHWSRQPIENLRTRRELKSLLTDAGFQTIKVTTLLPGFGRGGIRNFTNSGTLAGLADRVGIRDLWDEARNRCGLGLHIGVIARK